jgi:predicted lipid carrier protein YhbT
MQSGTADNHDSLPTPLLRLVPHPSRLAAPLRLVPSVLLRAAAQQAVARVLDESLASGRLDEFGGRRVCVEVVDLGLKWVILIGQRSVEVLDGTEPADAAVRGSATDLLLLASRLEDADTLFFHRRLQLVGDVELGLAVRNLLDQLPWESIPLGLRIALSRGARLARAARAAHRGTED